MGTGGSIIGNAANGNNVLSGETTQNNVTAPSSTISATFNEATANSPMFNEVAQNGAQSGNTQLPINTNNGIIETGGSNNELLLNASSQWNVGEGARGQNRELAEGAGRNQSRETQAERRNYFGNLFSNEAVSARSERIGNQEISIAPLSQNIINNTPYVAEVIKAYADKGVTLVPLADSFSFTKKDGTTAYARAVYSNGTIYASVVDPEATLEELSAHEDFHRLVANSRGDIILEMASDLEEQFGEENIRERARQYESAYSGVYDSAGSLDIIEELCADVYAGMNNADLSQIVNKAVEGLEGEANGDTRFSINPNFTKQYDEWDKNPSGGYFNVGTTSQAFQSIGVDPKKIRWYKNKIVEIKNTHLEMTDDIIKKVPEILENPILIMQSVTVPNRVVAVGELTVPINLGDEVVEQPVICAVELRPNGEITNFNFVASAYARGVQSLIDNSDILYIDKNKNRTDEWLSFLRLQLPAEITHYGSIGTVTYYDSKVNNDTSKSKSSMQIALEEAGLVDSEGKAKSDIRLSISTAQELAYYKAANNGDTETAQRLVDEAAKAAGCVTNGKGKLIDLYHGTPSFGFTQFNGEIFTTDNKSVAAGYGKHEYAKERAISDKYIADDGTDKTLINNAKSVLGQSWRNVTNSDISSVIDETAKQSDSLAEAINSVWLIGDDCPQLPADVDNAVSWLLSLPGSVSENLTDFANGDFPTRELAYWLDKFDESKPIAREYFSNHRSEFQGKTGKPIYDLIMGYDLGDYAIDLRYKTLPILDSTEYLINSTTGGLAEKSQLRSQIENVKSVGAYHLYGNLGSNPLVIDASTEGRSGFWANVKSEELGFEQGSTIESIVNKAKKSGYTSVVIKNVIDVAMNNYSSNVASDVYVFFDPSQVKSADPITYDDNGNVIPLSKRFSDSEDIRFSLTEEEAEGLTPAQQQVRDKAVS